MNNFFKQRSIGNVEFNFQISVEIKNLIAIVRVIIVSPNKSEFLTKNDASIILESIAEEVLDGIAEIKTFNKTINPIEIRSEWLAQYKIQRISS